MIGPDTSCAIFVSSSERRAGGIPHGCPAEGGSVGLIGSVGLGVVGGPTVGDGVGGKLTKSWRRRSQITSSSPLSLVECRLSLVAVVGERRETDAAFVLEIIDVRSKMKEQVPRWIIIMLLLCFLFDHNY